MAFDDDRMNDFCSVAVDVSPTWKGRTWVEGTLEYYDDEWGNTWHRIVGMSRKGEIYKGALEEDWARLKDYRLPDLASPERFEIAGDVFAADGDEHFRVGGLPGFPFNICRYLRKMEIYFQDLVLERDHIDELHDRVSSLLEQVIERFAEVGAAGISFCEDWGTQERLLISPAMWGEIFKPLFKRLCGKAHEHGMYVLMHSCGYIWDIIDDLAEVGVNAFLFDQPGLYGLERLADKFQTLKVCLFSPVDIQRVLPTGNRELIVAQAGKMVTLFGGNHGGFIANSYGDLKSIGVEPQWDRWAYDAFVETMSLEHPN